MNALTQWAVYFAPALIYWYRKRNGMKVVGSMGQAFWYNLLIGWTVIGWVMVLANAFGYDPVAYVLPGLVKRVVDVMPTTGAPPGAPFPSSGSSPQAGSCSMCGGSGSMTCSTCQGRGSWYDAPQGEHGVAQLRTCHACASSGRLRCSYCGGSGRAA